MAAGKLATVPADYQPAHGEAVTASGRLSAAQKVDLDEPSGPFTPVQLTHIDEALTLSSRTTGLDFSVYLGDLGEDSRHNAELLLRSTADGGAESVLVAISPNQRVLEIVTGPEARRRLPDRGCKLAVMSMVASFKEGDLAGGLVSGLRMLTDAAGTPPND
ncbi:uncharacterized protein DUF5130 [Tamaricihabitans halophyticus]|uniref:Uncharacterized protein DUF5130 n=1 Tax=Tamaricihabitans halophyticus TaxID=1262583 RepID=A0A4R2QH26_9PSEU|nr:DUF5130 family protein [Tamaricihabitans halophyticus]TCP48550.1 uncharacterized protein DUF5130 [Tamaricihabitans halophyticus]